MENICFFSFIMAIIIVNIYISTPLSLLKLMHNCISANKNSIYTNKAFLQDKNTVKTVMNVTHFKCVS